SPITSHINVFFGAMNCLCAFRLNRTNTRLFRKLFRAPELVFGVNSPNQGVFTRSRVRVPEAPPSTSAKECFFLCEEPVMSLPAQPNEDPLASQALPRSRASLRGKHPKSRGEI